jgi:hypothetical protein
MRGTQGALDALQGPAVQARQRARGGNEYAPGAAAGNLRPERIFGRAAEHDALVRSHVQDAGLRDVL